MTLRPRMTKLLVIIITTASSLEAIQDQGKLGADTESISFSRQCFPEKVLPQHVHQTRLAPSADLSHRVTDENARTGDLFFGRRYSFQMYVQEGLPRHSLSKIEPLLFKFFSGSLLASTLSPSPREGGLRLRAESSRSSSLLSSITAVTTRIAC